MILLNIIIIILLVVCCTTLQYTKDAVNCDEFFHGNPWPQPQDSDNRGVVKLCQAQKHNVLGKVVFASLFSTTDRIPLYTANTVILLPNASSHDRPDSEYWTRVAMGLCNITSLPSNAIISDVRHPGLEYKTCRKYQAVNDDYKDNNMNLERGHLSPNSINSQDLEKQRGTFTLTNAAPQFAEFNQNSWREYECVTQNAILDYVPGEKVYIITGTFGVSLDNTGKPVWMNGNSAPNDTKSPVKIPGFYWKAVCYPGNPSKNKAAWGYAVVEKNVDVKSKADFNSYITLKDFSIKYFEDDPFGPDCMNAPFGDFAKIFPMWDDYLDKHCQVAEEKTIKVQQKAEL